MNNHRNRKAWRDRIPTRRSRERPIKGFKVDEAQMIVAPAEEPKTVHPTAKKISRKPRTPAIIPRQPYGVGDYMESDRDWVLNNLEACVAFLEAATIIKRRKRP